MAPGPDGSGWIGFSSDAKIEAPISRAWFATELSLRTLERRVRLVPLASILAFTWWFGTERPIVVDDVVVEPEARDRPRCAIPGLAIARARWPLPEGIDQPIRSAVDDPVGKDVPQLVVVAAHLLENVLNPVSFGTDLHRVTELAFEASTLRS